MNYKISKELAEALLQYLAKRPFEEVFQLINALQRLEKLEEKGEIKKEEKK